MSSSVHEAGIDAKAAEPDAAHDVLRVIEALLTRAQRAGAVREDAGLPGLPAGACLAAKQQHWDEPLRTRTLRAIFDGLRGGPRSDLRPKELSLSGVWLAGAVRPEEPGDHPGLDMKVDPVDRGHTAVDLRQR